MYLSLAVLGQSTLWCIFFTCENQFKDCLSAEPKGQTLRIEESFKDKSPSIWGMGGKFSSVASNSLRPHGLQYTRIPCPSPTPEAYSNSCPLSRWCHPTISSSVVPFSSRLQSYPASGSFPMSQFFTSGGQSAGISASASVLPVNIQDWFPLGWTGWISLQSKGLSRVFSNTTVQKHRLILRHSAFFMLQLSYPTSTWWKSSSLLLGSDPNLDVDLALLQNCVLCCVPLRYVIQHNPSSPPMLSQGSSTIWFPRPAPGSLLACITLGIVLGSDLRGRRQWHPTPVLLPGKSHGQRSLVGCSPWGC